MLKYQYKNATVYITEPTEKHIRNIRKATEIYMRRVTKEKIQNEDRRDYRRSRKNNSNKGKRNR